MEGSNVYHESKRPHKKPKRYMTTSSESEKYKRHKVSYKNQTPNVSTQKSKSFAENIRELRNEMNLHRQQGQTSSTTIATSKVVPRPHCNPPKPRAPNRRALNKSINKENTSPSIFVQQSSTNAAVSNVMESNSMISDKENSLPKGDQVVEADPGTLTHTTIAEQSAGSTTSDRPINESTATLRNDKNPLINEQLPSFVTVPVPDIGSEPRETLDETRGIEQTDENSGDEGNNSAYSDQQSDGSGSERSYDESSESINDDTSIEDLGLEDQFPMRNRYDAHGINRPRRKNHQLHGERQPVVHESPAEMIVYQLRVMNDNITRMNKRLLKVEKSLRRNRQGGHCVKKPSFSPFQTREEVEAFKHSTQDTYDNMVSYLKYIGGFNAPEAVKLCFNECLTEKLAFTYTWLGLDTGHVLRCAPLYDTKLVQAIKEAVSNNPNFAAPTKLEFSEIFRNVIRVAKQRCRNKKRAKRPTAHDVPAV